MTTPLNILVIDDSVWNQKSALALREDGHSLTVANTATVAYHILEKVGEQFDVVLTDLWLPVPGYRMYAEDSASFLNTVYSPKKAEDQDLVKDQIPAGLIFAIAAKNRGVRFVGICTDTNHHTDRLNAVMDLMGYCYNDWPNLKRNPNGIFKHDARDFCLKEKYDTETDTLVETDERVINQKGRYRLVKDWRKVLQAVLKGS